MRVATGEAFGMPGQRRVEQQRRPSIVSCSSVGVKAGSANTRVRFTSLLLFSSDELQLKKTSACSDLFIRTADLRRDAEKRDLFCTEQRANLLFIKANALFLLLYMSFLCRHPATPTPSRAGFSQAKVGS